MIEVKQRDREAASAFPMPDGVAWPWEPLVQAFARHRRETLEEAAKEAEAVDIVGTVEQWRYGEPHEIAQAIRNLK